jgi:hypothetical protein
MAGGCRECWVFVEGKEVQGSPVSHAQGVGALGSPSLPWTTGHLSV